MGNYTYLCNRLPPFENCLCCFKDMHLYSNNLSTVATISSLIKSESFPACFSCNSNFNLSQSSSASDAKNFVEIPEAGTIQFDDLGNLISVRSRVLFLP